MAAPSEAVFIEKQLASLLKEPVFTVTAPPVAVAVLPVNFDDEVAVTSLPPPPCTPPPLTAEFEEKSSPITARAPAPVARSIPPPVVLALLLVQVDPVDVTFATMSSAMPPPTQATLLVNLHLDESVKDPLVHTPPPATVARLPVAVRATSVPPPVVDTPPPLTAAFETNAVDDMDSRHPRSIADTPPPLPSNAILFKKVELVSVKLLSNCAITPPPLPVMAVLLLKTLPTEERTLADKLTAPPELLAVFWSKLPVVT